MTRKSGLIACWVIAAAFACNSEDHTEVIVAEVPLDSLDEVITKSGVEMDAEVTSDGRGSLRVNASQPARVRIAEVDGLTVDDAQLIYRARLRSRELRGHAFLEMWCVFPGQGEFFSRALQSPLTGTNDWVTQETPFLLKEGQTPSRVVLNLIVEGQGTVWLDDIVLAKTPL
ncbi:MAG: hypothetical protein OXU20_19645 [Myxococcales bacterium]|nr:hypothetical protein [Myxococcales bacterium]